MGFPTYSRTDDGSLPFINPYLQQWFKRPEESSLLDAIGEWQKQDIGRAQAKGARKSMELSDSISDDVRADPDMPFEKLLAKAAKKSLELGDAKSAASLMDAAKPKADGSKLFKVGNDVVKIKANGESEKVFEGEDEAKTFRLGDSLYQKNDDGSFTKILQNAKQIKPGKPSRWVDEFGNIVWVDTSTEEGRREVEQRGLGENLMEAIMAAQMRNRMTQQPTTAESGDGSNFLKDLVAGATGSKPGQGTPPKEKILGNIRRK